jgi:hypothetical protein
VLREATEVAAAIEITAVNAAVTSTSEVTAVTTASDPFSFEDFGQRLRDSFVPPGTVNQSEAITWSLQYLGRNLPSLRAPRYGVDLEVPEYFELDRVQHAEYMQDLIALDCNVAQIYEEPLIETEEDISL